MTLNTQQLVNNQYECCNPVHLSQYCGFTYNCRPTYGSGVAHNTKDSHEHSAATVTELLQPQDPACGTLFQFNYAIWTSPTDCSDNSWRHTFFGKHEHSVTLICGALQEHLLTYLKRFYIRI